MNPSSPRFRSRPRSLEIEPIDLNKAGLFLASDEARYVTGLPMSIDAGFLTEVG